MPVTKYSQNYFKIIEKYKNFHINGTKKLPPSKTFAGHSLVKWVFKIKKIIHKSNSKTIIDYGCGKAFLYHNQIKIGEDTYKNLQEYWVLNHIFLYDPAVDEYSQPPPIKKLME